VPEHIQPYTDSRADAPPTTTFSSEACALLGHSVREYMASGGVPEELARATARLCQEAQSRGLSADETLTEIRAMLGGLLADCPLTSSDRAALVALAVRECVHAFYSDQH
jgi:hypothetical protein